jgi:lipoate-protein ligase B
MNLGHVDFLQALSIMRQEVEVKRQGSHPEVLMQLEHEPVLTLGRNAKNSNILASESDLKRRGISIHRVERGGQVTYHGPGQLVGYTLFDLRQMGIGPSDLVSGLESVIIKTLSEFGINGEQKEGFRGVWVGNDKIASIGIAVRQGISFHGFALNYDPDLTHFELITPCGLNGVRMTSICKILGSSIDEKNLRKLTAQFLKEHFDLYYMETSLT